MILKEKDKEIIRYVEKYGFITIAQAYDIWFSQRRYGYDSARKRLQLMVNDNYLKQQYDMEEMYSPKIFYIEDKYRKPRKSMILTMDVYGYIVRMGAKIIYFKREQEWLNKEYRTDAFVVFLIGEYCYSAFIEVLNSNQTGDMSKNSKFKNKYIDIINSPEPQNKLKEITKVDRTFDSPKLLLVDDIKHKNTLEIDDLNIITVNSKLEGLSKILI